MVITVVDQKTRKILTSKRERNTLTGTAIYNTGISIDTAKYQLNNSTLAFGIRTSWEGSSVPNPYNSESLNLYILQDSKLIKILSEMNVSEYSGEWDTRCNGNFLSRERILMITPSASRFNDIVVKEHTESIRSTASADDCQQVTFRQKPKQYKLAFVKNSYIVPDSLRFRE